MVTRTGVAIGLAWVLLIALYYLLPVTGRTGGATFLRLGSAVFAFCLVVAWQTFRIMRARLPELRAAQAIGVALPLFFVLFSSVYLGMNRAAPGDFSEHLDHTTALYFVVTVFSTVGFGDIVPKTDTTRVVVTVQMVLDLLLIAVVVKLLFGTAKATLARAGSQGPSLVSGNNDSGSPPPRISEKGM